MLDEEICLKVKKWKPDSQADQIFAYKIKATLKLKGNYLKPTQPERSTVCQEAIHLNISNKKYDRVFRLQAELF